jgi:hypothetical protein
MTVGGWLLLLLLEVDAVAKDVTVVVGMEKRIVPTVCTSFWSACVWEGACGSSM